MATRRLGLIVAAVAASLGGVLLSRALVIRISPGYLPTTESMDRELLKAPTLVAIKAIDPDTYARIREIALDGARRGRSKPEVQAAVRASIATSMRKYLPHASASAVLKITRVTAIELDQFGVKSADACVDFLFPNSARPVNITDFVSREVMEQDQAAEQAVFESAADPQPVPTQPAVAPALRGVAGRLANKFGADAMASFAHPATMTHAALCEITSAFLKEILALPASDSVPLLRYLYAQSTDA